MEQIKIKFVSVETGITTLGFRRVVAVARKLNPNTEVYFITPGNLYSLATHINPSRKPDIDKGDLKLIARNLSCADLVCFSTMTTSSSYVEKLSLLIKKYNPNTYILWGGPHCILNPESAINYVDAICTGEGEIPYKLFYRSFVNQKSYIKTPSMWFKVNGKIFKNKNYQLNSNTILNKLPHPFWGYNCSIYDNRIKSFRPFSRKDYRKYNGLSYSTIWSIGCPFACVYCANNAFVNLDPKYRILRYPSVDYLIEEIETAIKLYPFISTIIFIDDNFIALPYDKIKEFCLKYKKRINLPFVVFGLHPNLVEKNKIRILGQTGMNRGRIGIQSGSPNTLRFYNRYTPINNILKSTTVMANAVNKYHMIPTAYDIISDNPVETRTDLIDTLKLLYKIKRPYTLNIYSLRVFPKTQLYDYFIKNPKHDLRKITSPYLETQKTAFNILLYILATFKPPLSIFNWSLKYVKPTSQRQTLYPKLYFLVKLIYLSSRAIAHLEHFDFSTLSGNFSYSLWSLGFIKSRFRPQMSKLFVTNKN
jgi:radical SAM superfamily enzyme YgiQ (UPF0313 family)